MQLPYQTYLFTLQFDHETHLQKFPPFFIRSVIGKELRRVACVFPGRNCIDCSVREKCAYSFLFETPIDKNTPFLRGRNFAPHPFVLSMPPLDHRRGRQLNMTLTLMGKGREYFPYFYYAIQKSGEEGLFFQRMPFRIADVTVDGASIIKNENTIIARNSEHTWQLNPDLLTAEDHALAIELVTPLRFKKMGKYQKTLNYRELLGAIYYRALLLGSLYGNGADGLPPRLPSLNNQKQERGTFVWQDLKRYSARQKTEIRLGGITGSLFVEGRFTPFEISLLRAGEMFHVGKNAGFGLGKIRINKINTF